MKKPTPPGPTVEELREALDDLRLDCFEIGYWTRARHPSNADEYRKGANESEAKILALVDTLRSDLQRKTRALKDAKDALRFGCFKDGFCQPCVEIIPNPEREQHSPDCPVMLALRDIDAALNHEDREDPKP